MIPLPAPDATCHACPTLPSAAPHRCPAAGLPAAAWPPPAGHWPSTPLRPPPVPAVKQAAWPRTPVDNFILAKLEEQRLAPAQQAYSRTLIRRVTFDLIGLPPTPEEVDAFLK